jgi:hypothetical protein
MAPTSAVGKNAEKAVPMKCESLGQVWKASRESQEERKSILPAILGT